MAGFVKRVTLAGNAGLGLYRCGHSIEQGRRFLSAQRRRNGVHQAMPTIMIMEIQRIPTSWETGGFLIREKKPAMVGTTGSITLKARATFRIVRFPGTGSIKMWPRQTECLSLPIRCGGEVGPAIVPMSLQRRLPLSTASFHLNLTANGWVTVMK